MAKKTSKTSSSSNQMVKTKAVQMVKAPVAVGTKIKGTGSPKQIQHNRDSITVSHTEYVGDIVGIIGGSESTYTINPQQAATFTWLSALATRFEMYKFKKLKFHYSPSCTTTTGDWLILGVDFDAYDDFPSKPAMLAWRYSQKTVPWQPITLDVSADAKLSTYRYCDDDYRGDKRLDLLGNLFVLASTSGSNIYFGEIMVEYTVELRIPSYKVPAALYQTMLGNSMTGPAQWFTNLATNTGNILYDVVAEDKILIREVGKFLLQGRTTASSGVNQAISVTASTDPAHPTADYTLTNIFYDYTTLAANMLYTLVVDVAPVLLTFAGGSGTIIFPNVRLSTFVD